MSTVQITILPEDAKAAGTYASDNCLMHTALRRQGFEIVIYPEAAFTKDGKTYGANYTAACKAYGEVVTEPILVTLKEI